MRSRSTDMMEKIIAFIDQYFCEKHVTPSASEVGLAVGLSKATAFRYLVEMDERGLIEYDGKARTIVTPMIRKFTLESSPCPLVGSVPCGTAEEKEECIQEYISLPVSLFGNGSYYILEASGDSMVDAGIDDGDKVVISTSSQAKEGDIIVALTDSNESTLKRFGGIDQTTNEARLLYQNRAVYPNKEIRVKRLVIQGIARHVIKSL